MRILSVMRSGSVLGMLAIATTLTVPTSAEARCKGSDIRGDYQIHISIRQIRTEFWTTCRIKVARNGTVRSSGTCRFDDGDTKAVRGGSLRVNRACRVSGTITIGTEDHDISSATMSLSKDFFAGVGDLDSKPTTFNAVRL